MPRDIYRPLLAYLNSLPPEQTAVTLPFAQTEALAGRVAESARTSSSYWRQATRSLYWRAAGWEARLNLAAGSVTVTRTAAAPRPEA